MLKTKLPVIVLRNMILLPQGEIKLEDIKVTKKEIDEEIKKAAQTYGISEEEFKEHVGSTDMIEYELQMRKAIDVIKK